MPQKANASPITLPANERSKLSVNNAGSSAIERPERRTPRPFHAVWSTTHEQQARHIRAGEQQNKRDRSEEHEQRGLRLSNNLFM